MTDVITVYGVKYEGKDPWPQYIVTDDNALRFCELEVERIKLKFPHYNPIIVKMKVELEEVE